MSATKQIEQGSGLAVVAGAWCRGEETVAALARETGFTVVEDRDLVAAATARSGLPESVIGRAFSPRISVFDKFSGEKEQALAWLRLALAELLERPGLLLYGRLAHLVPREITHLLKVCLIADLPFRAEQAGKAEQVSEKEALRRIAAADGELAYWTGTLLGQDDPWAAALYDLLLPMAATEVAEATALITRTLTRDAVRPGAASRQALADFRLAAQAGVELSRAGHEGAVTAAAGAVTVTINKKVLMFNRLQEELQAIVGALPGVATVRVEVAEDLRPAEIYRRHDVAKPSKVLLVDDEREFVQTLSERLIFRDVGAAVAYDGQSALEMLADEDPDVLVLDLKMPGIDGIEVLRRVKKIRPEVEVIILTGHGSEDDRQVCMELGAFAYLQKPVDIELLDQRLKEAHARVQQRRGRG